MQGFKRRRGNSIPDFGRRFAVDAKLSEFELSFLDPVHQFLRKRFNPSIAAKRSLIDR
jgi:hypothetical protein